MIEVGAAGIEPTSVALKATILTSELSPFMPITSRINRATRESNSKTRDLQSPDKTTLSEQLNTLYSRKGYCDFSPFHLP